MCRMARDSGCLYNVMLCFINAIIHTCSRYVVLLLHFWTLQANHFHNLLFKVIIFHSKKFFSSMLYIFPLMCHSIAGGQYVDDLKDTTTMRKSKKFFSLVYLHSIIIIIIDTLWIVYCYFIWIVYKMNVSRLVKEDYRYIQCSHKIE